jgi:hypothetical protein
MNVTLEVIDQRRVQKRGGDFARYPSSYVVCSLLRRYGLRRVLDVTYGEGRFYYLCKSDVEVVAADPVKWQWVVKPKQFLQLNVFQLYMMLRDGKLQMCNVDAVVVDPPKWNTEVSYRRRDMYNYIVGTPRIIIEYATRVAELLKAAHLLVHYRSALDIDAYRPIHIVEFTWVARYQNTKNKNKSLYILYRART